jgi:hypothetical protein
LCEVACFSLVICFRKSGSCKYYQSNWIFNWFSEHQHIGSIIYLLLLQYCDEVAYFYSGCFVCFL